MHKNKRKSMLSKSDRENGLARLLKTYLVSLIKRDRRKREKGEDELLELRAF